MFGKVSIVIPVYNSEKYLKKCLDSIIMQSYRNFEVILINDGSIDNSGDICDLYCSIDKRFKVMHQENLGVSAARNKGIELATGKYLIFIDSDDQVMPNMLEKMVGYVNEYDVDVLISGITFVKEGKKVKDVIPKITGYCNGDIWNYIATDDTGIFGYISNKLYKTKIIKDNNINFNVNRKIQEDLEFALKVYSACNNFYLLDKSYYLYTQEEKNRTPDVLGYIEIEILKRKILKQKNKYKNENKIYHCSKIASMIFSYLYWLPKNKDDFIKQANLIYKIENIEESFELNSINGFENKMTIFLLKNKMIRLIYIFFKFRSIRNRT